MTSENLIELRASAPRRVVGVGVFLILGLMLIYLAIATPPAEMGFQVLLIVLGAGAIWMADIMRRATRGGLVLTEEGLFTDTGEEVARFDQIDRIERGTFANKPSNGFALKLTDKAPRAWAPGLWWRYGRKVGVGGVTSAPQCKAMAEVMTAKLAERA